MFSDLDERWTPAIEAGVVEDLEEMLVLRKLLRLQDIWEARDDGEGCFGNGDRRAGGGTGAVCKFLTA